MTTDQPTLTTEAVLDRSSLSASTLYRKVVAGTFPKPVRRGRDNIWEEAEFERWMADPEHYRAAFQQVPPTAAD